MKKKIGAAAVLRKQINTLTDADIHKYIVKIHELIGKIDDPKQTKRNAANPTRAKNNKTLKCINNTRANTRGATGAASAANS